jgi:hypothetical protein
MIREQSVNALAISVELKRIGLSEAETLSVLNQLFHVFDKANKEELKARRLAKKMSELSREDCINTLANMCFEMWRDS